MLTEIKTLGLNDLKKTYGKKKKDDKYYIDIWLELINKNKNRVSIKTAYQSRINSFYSAKGSPISNGLDTEGSGLKKDEIYLDRIMIHKITNRLSNKNYKLVIKLLSLLGLRISDVIRRINKESQK